MIVLFLKRIKPFKDLLKSTKGGLATIIAMVVTIILVLLLISYAVLSQVESAKDTGDKAKMEQQKVSHLLQNPDSVTGNTVKDYINRATAEGSILTVSVQSYDEDGTLGTAVEYTEGDSGDDSIEDSALYTMSKTYNANGLLSEVSFVQVDLSR